MRVGGYEPTLLAHPIPVPQGYQNRFVTHPPVCEAKVVERRNSCRSSDEQGETGMQERDLTDGTQLIKQRHELYNVESDIFHLVMALVRSGRLGCEK